MRLNEKIKGSFDFTIDKTKSEILETIENRKQNQQWTDFLLTDTFDFKGIVETGGQLEILRKPTTFSPFRPYGKIIININTIGESKSKLTGETIPFNRNLPFTLILIFGFNGLWTIGVLLTIKITIALPMAFITWSVFGLIIFLQYKYYKWGLLNYTKRLVTELTKDKKASR